MVKFSSLVGPGLFFVVGRDFLFLKLVFQSYCLLLIFLGYLHVLGSNLVDRMHLEIYPFLVDFPFMRVCTFKIFPDDPLDFRDIYFNVTFSSLTL
jgi:hypothetical protein